MQESENNLPMSNPLHRWLALPTLLLTGCFGTVGASGGGSTSGSGVTLFVGSNSTGFADGSAAHPFLDISDALKAAPSGATIRVGSGVYDETLAPTAPVTLIGESASTTTLRGPGTRSVISIDRIAGVTVRGLTITGGFAADGAAVLATRSTVTLQDCVFTGNDTGPQGATPEKNTASVVHLLLGTGLIERCLFAANTTIAIGGGASGQVTVRNCIITGSDGNAINITGDDTTLNPDLILSNVVVHGSANNGLQVGSFADMLVTNCIFFDNASRSVAESTNAGDPVMRFNRFFEYRDTDDDITIRDGAALDALTPPGTNTGNIVADPLFVDAAGGDFRLTGASPCIDAGDPTLRDPDDTRSDMGAFGGPGGAWDETFAAVLSTSFALPMGSGAGLQQLLDSDPAAGDAEHPHRCDWNLDGIPDLLRTDASGRLQLRLSSRRGGSTYAGLLPAGLPPVTAFTTQDLDGDQRPDLVIRSLTGIEVYLHRGAAGSALTVHARPGDEIVVQHPEAVLRVTATDRPHEVEHGTVVGIGRLQSVDVVVERAGIPVARFPGVAPGTTLYVPERTSP